MNTGVRPLAVSLVGLFWYSTTATAAGSLFEAVKSEKLDEISTLVARGQDINQPDGAGQSPLLQAAIQADNSKLIDHLVVLGADIHATDRAGRTSLMLAAKNGRIENATRLLVLGVNPDAGDSAGKTVLDYARAAGLTEEINNRPSLVSTLEGKNHNEPNRPPQARYILLRDPVPSADEFRKSAIRALAHKGWNITQAGATSVQAFYYRPRQGELYKVRITVEPKRIAIQYQPRYGFGGEEGYLEAIRAALIQELAIY